MPEIFVTDSSALTGTITSALMTERDGGKGEAERVCELTLRYSDGRLVTVRAQSCGCCGGASWDAPSVLARPTVPEAIPLARAIYARPDGAGGCCLHIVLDDFNVDQDSVDHCLARALERGHEDCSALAAMLVRMTKTQRLKVAHHRY
jgi:hypothetical protein